MMPFAIDHRNGDGSHIDLSFLLDAPAGKDGFVVVRDGHLTKPDGTRLRLWGVNITEWSPGSVMLPAKADAPIYAAALARHGVNCVRLHFLDLPAPRGIIDPGFDDSSHFDAAQLDRLDFWVAELKRYGIYCDLNLMVGRSFKAGDGVEDFEQIGWAKGVSYYSPRLIELQKAYARQLLTHHNPYTGNEYRNEPAIVIVELVNENSLVEAWWHGRTHPVESQDNDPNWRTVPVFYADLLTRLYNQYLEQELAVEELIHLRQIAGVDANGQVPRLRRSQFADAPQEQFLREASFYMEVERRFFREMHIFLREELGVRSLLLGSSDHNHEWSGYPHIWANNVLDIIDGHDYWQHEAFPGDKNTPMVNDPLGSIVARLSRTAVAGKPFIVSEVNHPFPHDWRAEGIPILASYASLQDWDGVIWYTVELKSDPDWQAYVGDAFDMSLDPLKMPQLAAGALLFLRGDVQAAHKTINRSYSAEQVRETLRMERNNAPYYTPGFPLGAVFEHQVRIHSFEEQPSAHYSGTSNDTFVSDTNELSWKTSLRRGGIVTVDAACSQALIGFVKANPTTLHHLAAHVTNDFCVITLAALDDQPIATSSRLLLTTGARVENTGQQWNANRTKTIEHGHAPALIEPVCGTLMLHNLASAVAVRAYPLDGAGKPFGSVIVGLRSDANWRLELGAAATTWYEVVVER